MSNKEMTLEDCKPILAKRGYEMSALDVERVYRRFRRPIEDDITGESMFNIYYCVNPAIRAGFFLADFKSLTLRSVFVDMMDESHFKAIERQLINSMAWLHENGD